MLILPKKICHKILFQSRIYKDYSLQGQKYKRKAPMDFSIRAFFVVGFFYAAMELDTWKVYKLDLLR